MAKCPKCEVSIGNLTTTTVTYGGLGHAPHRIEVLLISCSSCSTVLGVLPAPR